MGDVTLSARDHDRNVQWSTLLGGKRALNSGEWARCTQLGVWPAGWRRAAARENWVTVRTVTSLPGSADGFADPLSARRMTGVSLSAAGQSPGESSRWGWPLWGFFSP